ncbi:hypothetical protein ACHAQJ_009272 [Trichoderma viride]
MSRPAQDSPQHSTSHSVKIELEVDFPTSQGHQQLDPSSVRIIGVQVNPLSTQGRQQHIPRSVRIKLEVDSPILTSQYHQQPNTSLVRVIQVQANPLPTSRNQQQATIPAAAATTPRVSQQTAFRPVSKIAPLAHTPGTAINASDTEITTSDTAINAPNTASALVKEFLCLYSKDRPKKKQKKWHNGILKFHTFNRKFMVYDDESKVYIGEGHWHGHTDSFEEGIETMLDQPITCIQVMEHTRSTEQDLAPILGKRTREVEERRVAMAQAKRSRQRPLGDLSINEIPQLPLINTSTAAIAPVHHKKTPKTPISSISSVPLGRGGAWTEHARDLLGKGRPTPSRPRA